MQKIHISIVFVLSLIVMYGVYWYWMEDSVKIKDIVWYLDNSLVVSSGYVIGTCDNPRQTEIKIKEKVGSIDPILIDVCVAEVHAFKTREELCNNLVLSELPHIGDCK